VPNISFLLISGESSFINCSDSLLIFIAYLVQIVIILVMHVLFLKIYRDFRLIIFRRLYYTS